MKTKRNRIYRSEKRRRAAILADRAIEVCSNGLYEFSSRVVRGYWRDSSSRRHLANKQTHRKTTRGKRRGIPETRQKTVTAETKTMDTKYKRLSTKKRKEEKRPRVRPAGQRTTTRIMRWYL